SNQPR
ncbi:unnamed protein product, partial [Rotaria sordida]